MFDCEVTSMWWENGGISKKKWNNCSVKKKKETNSIYNVYHLHFTAFGEKTREQRLEFSQKNPQQKTKWEKNINVSVTLHWGEIEDSFERGLFGKKNANSGKSFCSPPAKTKKQREKKMINTSMSLVLEGENWGLF